MTLEDVKKTIEQQTGIPANILTADTEADVIAQARSILAYKNKQENQRLMNTREQFAKWARDLVGMEEPDTASAALEEIAEAVRVDAGGFPRVRGGSIDSGSIPDPRPVREQFSSWLRNQMAFNPFKVHEGDW